MLNDNTYSNTNQAEIVRLHKVIAQAHRDIAVVMGDVDGSRAGQRRRVELWAEWQSELGNQWAAIATRWNNLPEDDRKKYRPSGAPVRRNNVRAQVQKLLRQRDRTKRF